MTDIPPGRCGTPAPSQMRPYGCELLAGHAGMHQANDYGAMAADKFGIAPIVAWSDPEGGWSDVTPSPGVWVTYFWDMGIHIEQAWPDELSAMRAANDTDYHKAGFLPYGTDAREALK